MKKRIALKRTVGVLLVTMATVGSVVAYSVATASADGRTLDASFCAAPLPHFCLQVNGTAYYNGSPDRVAGQPDLTLQPGTYWINVTDDSNFHNFALRSCPGNDSTALCDNGPANASAPVQAFSPLNNANVTPDMNCSNADGTLTCSYKVLLTHGTYRLFCEASGHEHLGMFVDIAVGGVGQV
jgi:hypothetical protein